MANRSQNARKHKFNENYFEQIDNNEKAYWFGFLMADGCVYKGSDKHSYRLQINLKASDIEQLEAFQRAIESNYSIQIKSLKNSDAAILKINSTKMCMDLINHGLTERKSLVCKFPDINEKYISSFILGYFDGDGCITNKNKNRWTFGIVGGEEMLRSIQSKLPVETYIYKIKHSEAVSLETSSHKNIYQLFKWLYNDASIFLQRKYNKFIEFENTYMSRLTEM